MKKPHDFFEVSHAASLCLASWLSVLRQHGGKCGMWVRPSLTVRSIGCHLMTCMTWYDMVVLFQTGMQELQSTQTMLWMLHRCDISSLKHETPQIIIGSSKSRDAIFAMHMFDWEKKIPCNLFAHISLQLPNRHGEASTSCERWCWRSSSKVTWNERWKLWCCG